MKINICVGGSNKTYLLKRLGALNLGADRDVVLIAKGNRSRLSQKIICKAIYIEIIGRAQRS